MPRAAYRTLLTATAGDDADAHTVLLELSARQIRRIAMLGRLVRRHQLSTVTIAMAFDAWEGTASAMTVTDPQAIDAWIAEHGQVGDLHTDTEEIVVGFAGASIWLSFRVKNIDRLEWQTDSIRIADLEAALQRPLAA